MQNFLRKVMDILLISEILGSLGNSELLYGCVFKKWSWGVGNTPLCHVWIMQNLQYISSPEHNIGVN